MVKTDCHYFGNPGRWENKKKIKKKKNNNNNIMIGDLVISDDKR